MGTSNLRKLSYEPAIAFSEAMGNAGYDLHEAPIPDGKLHRFPHEDRNGGKCGWYVLHTDGIPAGSFGDWRSGQTFTWCSKAETSLSQKEKAEYRRRIETQRKIRDQERAKQHKNAAMVAKKRWDAADPETGDHPYLKKKSVQSHHLRREGDLLLIPMKDADSMVSLQTIDPDGNKLFLTGGRKKGCCFFIKGNDTFYICEGYATGATIHKATGGTVVVAFDAGNLLPVAESLRAKHKDARIILCGDDDQWKATNAGIEKGRAAASKIGALFVSPRFHDLTTKPTDFNDLANLEGIEAVKRQLQPDISQIRTPTGFGLVRASDMEAKPPVWIVKGFIEADTEACLFGETYTGKSYLAIDLACCIATGSDFHGLPIKKAGPVIYIAGEGHAGISRRVAAWSLWRQIDTSEAPLFFSRVAANLITPESTADVVVMINEVAARYGAPVLIVIDTLARNFGPGDENAAKDMNQFVAACDTLRGQYGSTTLVLHHTGVADKYRARGSTTLKASLDAEYRFDQDEDGVCRIESTKMKDAERADPMAFGFITQEIGIYDEDGQPVTSAVLDRTEYTHRPAKTSNAGQGKNQIAALAALNELKGDQPIPNRVSVEAWQKACKAEMDRKAFHKVKESLSRQRIITITEGFVS
jgi:putative DNA primase/helicase